jgi:hypothetical protein
VLFEWAIPYFGLCATASLQNRGNRRFPDPNRENETHWEQFFKSEVTVIENGERLRLPALDAFVKRTFAGAMNGNAQDKKILLQFAGSSKASDKDRLTFIVEGWDDDPDAWRLM